MPERGRLKTVTLKRKPVVDKAAKLVQGDALIVEEGDDLTLLVIFDAKPEN